MSPPRLFALAVVSDLADLLGAPRLAEAVVRCSAAGFAGRLGGRRRPEAIRSG
jgi:hypothetical protein